LLEEEMVVLDMAEEMVVLEQILEMMMPLPLMSEEFVVLERISEMMSLPCDNPPRKIPYYHLKPIHFGHLSNSKVSSCR
jgi:hypothetical protein